MKKIDKGKILLISEEISKISKQEKEEEEEV